MTERATKLAVNTHQTAHAPSANAVTPLVDIYQDEQGTTFLVAEMPGVNMEDVDIRVDKGVLTISAASTMPPRGDQYAPTYRGFAAGEYFRAFALSDEVDREKIEATLVDGLLNLRLPRAAAAQTRKIAVRGQ